MKQARDLIIICGIIILIAWFVAASRPFKLSGDFLSGQPAKNFTLSNLEGEEVEFDQFRQGKKVLLFFWATWCPHCRDKIVQMPVIAKRLAEKDVELLLINVGEPLERAKQYLSNVNAQSGTLLDYNSDVSYSYQAAGLPWFVLVDEQGVIQTADFDVPL